LLLNEQLTLPHPVLGLVQLEFILLNFLSSVLGAVVVEQIALLLQEVVAAVVAAAVLLKKLFCL
jgi:hypothetical protein